MTGLPRRYRTSLIALVVGLACGMGVAGAQGQTPRATPVPNVTGPIPVTTTSYPFLAADRLAEPMDLASVGYMEQEYFVSGSANVYDWAADGSLSVKRSNAPYSTRILVRRPVDASRFSGNVIVELGHAPRGIDFPLMWGWSQRYILEHGDAYVLVTMSPEATRALQRFNSARYASLSWANPNPSEACAPGGNGANANMPQTSDVEEGLRWDMISQVGALLKSTLASRPLADLTVEYLYLTTQDAAHQTYIHAIQPRSTLADGRPIYDGHLTKSANRAARIRRCAAAPANGDPRNLTQNAGVPVINVLQENDVLGRLAVRRSDSDEPGDHYRLYEVPGTVHSGDAPYRWSTATMDDHAAVGGEVVTRRFSAAIAPFTLAAPLEEPGRCQPSEMISEQPLLSYIFHSSFANLDRWVRQGTPPPRADRMEVANAGTPQARLVTDQFGNGVGGVRTPYVDVPTATYRISHGTNPGCRGNFGYSEPFDWVRLDAEYGSYETYASKLNDALDRAVAERWLTETDAQKIRNAPVLPSGTGGN
jgi:hypothetical protein